MPAITNKLFVFLGNDMNSVGVHCVLIGQTAVLVWIKTGQGSTKHRNGISTCYGSSQARASHTIYPMKYVPYPVLFSLLVQLTMRQSVNADCHTLLHNTLLHNTFSCRHMIYFRVISAISINYIQLWRVEFVWDKAHLQLNDTRTPNDCF